MSKDNMELITTVLVSNVFFLMGFLADIPLIGVTVAMVSIGLVHDIFETID